MAINFNDKNFLIGVEDYTGSLLQKKGDISKLIEVVVAEKKEEEFEKLTFTAKYICGMMRVVKNAPGIPEVSSIDQIKSDLNENMKKGIEQLKDIIAFSGESERDSIRCDAASRRELRRSRCEFLCVLGGCRAHRAVPVRS